jgi:hypothetical protein
MILLVQLCHLYFAAAGFPDPMGTGQVVHLLWRSTVPAIGFLHNLSRIEGRGNQLQDGIGTGRGKNVASKQAGNKKSHAAGAGGFSYSKIQLILY